MEVAFDEKHAVTKRHEHCVGVVYTYYCYFEDCEAGVVGHDGVQMLQLIMGH